jgi:pimeloyl-ACP methyl ester carboxylesterase
MASDYVGLLDYLKVDKVALVGWSDGGIIGLDIAMKHPERLTKLFAQAANVTVDGVNPAVATNATFGAYIERMGKDYAKFSKTPDQYNAFLEQISKMWASEPAWTKEQLAGIKVPTAIVLGDHARAHGLHGGQYSGRQADHSERSEPFRNASGPCGIYQGGAGFSWGVVRKNF